MGFSPKKLWKTWAPHRRGGVDGTRCPRAWPPAFVAREDGKNLGKSRENWGNFGKIMENPGKTGERCEKYWKMVLFYWEKNMKTSNIYGGLLGKSSRIIFNWRESWENYQTEWKHGDNSGKNTVFFILWDISWDYDGRIWENGIRIMRNKVGKNTLFCL